jgi:hypothetical protein
LLTVIQFEEKELHNGTFLYAEYSVRAQLLLSMVKKEKKGEESSSHSQFVYDVILKEKELGEQVEE